MSSCEHANLAEYIERPLLGAPIPLSNPFGEIIFLRECLKSAQNATGTSQMHFPSKFESKTFLSKIWIFENDNLFGSGPVTTTTLPLLHVLLHVILHATLADGANVARPGHNCPKSSKMSSSEHANIAEYIERPLLGAPIPLRNPFGEIIFLRECLKSAQNATGTSQMHFQANLSKNDFVKNVEF